MLRPRSRPGLEDKQPSFTTRAHHEVMRMGRRAPLLHCHSSQCPPVPRIVSHSSPCFSPALLASAPTPHFPSLFNPSSSPSVLSSAPAPPPLLTSAPALPLPFSLQLLLRCCPLGSGLLALWHGRLYSRWGGFHRSTLCDTASTSLWWVCSGS